MEIRTVLYTASLKRKRLFLRWLFVTVIFALSVIISLNYQSIIEQTYISRGFVSQKTKSVDRMSTYAIATGGQTLILENSNQSELNIPSVQNLVLKHNLSAKLNDTKQQFNSTSEFPEIYLHSGRFDILIKMVYAYFYSVVKVVPEPIQRAYTEHLRVWYWFQEYCNFNERWFDATVPCKEKKNAADFISSFQNTIDKLKKHGFMSNMSQIPLDNTGFVLNGAHRLASSVILRQNATFQHLDYKGYLGGWYYKFFLKRGLSSKLTCLMMLEWMKIQVLLPGMKRKVSIISIVSNNSEKDKTMRAIVIENCSVDKHILFEHEINITKLGMRQLLIHMYGVQEWLGGKISEMISKFTSDKYKVLFIFFYGKNSDELTRCKNKVRKLYNDSAFQSTAHIPGTPEENLILAEMILNRNSVHFLNFARNGHECQAIAKELALRSFLKPVSTLPGIYIGRDDVMIDSDAVLHFFNLRERSDVAILFLNATDENVLGNGNGSGIHMEAHTFKPNAISPERAWGEHHFNERVKTKWDLFYDPDNYGFCYGLKFVSLKQLVDYKIKRNKSEKDQLISKLLKPT